MKNIKPFGPSIGKTKISDKFFNKLNKEFDAKSKSKKIDYSSKLASQIKNELKISDKFIKQNLEKELKFCVKTFLFNENIKNIKEIKILNLWVVRQFKGEYNPIHTHGGHLSGVGYLKVPSTFGEYEQSDKRNNQNGMLSLIHGSKMFLSDSTYTITPKVGDFYFFPNYLMHTVYPFSGSDEERRSISFNAYIDEDIYNVFQSKNS